MIEAIVTKILESAASGAVGVLVDAVKRENASLLAKERKILFVGTVQLVREALSHHISEINKWCETITFADLHGSRRLSTVYVDLDTYLMPQSTHLSKCEKEKITLLLPALQSVAEHTIILGGPGAGKTTSIKRICADFFLKGKVLLNFNFPLLIRLRDIQNNKSPHPLYDKIQQILTVCVVEKDKKSDKPEKHLTDAVALATINAYLEGLQALVLLDGFDELPDQDTRVLVLSDIRLLAQNLNKTRLILTSRSSDARYKFDELKIFEIAPLTKQVIESFSKRWLPTQEKSEDFLRRVFASPFSDTLDRPLTLAHLCAIYERTGTIPEKPKSVFRKIINLYLEEWDSQKSVERKSKYAGFNSDRKAEFLAQFAYILTTEFHTLEFDTYTLSKVYKKICTEYRLPDTESHQVVREIESHNGIILETSYEKYEFSHKSLQEFLAGDYLVRLPTVSMIVNMDIPRLANELAIATALSSKPTAYLAELTLGKLCIARQDRSWHSVFLSRLSLEKVDLDGQHSPDVALASLILLSNVDEPTEHVNLLLPTLQIDIGDVVKRYYRQINQDNQFTHFQRFGSHRDYKIPDHLSILSTLLKPINSYMKTI